MLRHLILVCCLLSTLYINAQQTSGRAVYVKSTAININPETVNPAIQMMLVDMPKSFDTRGELLFSADESLYKDLVSELAKQPEGPPNRSMTMSFSAGDPESYHLDLKTGRVQLVQSVLDRQFTVSDDALQFEWVETGRQGVDAITGLPTREATMVHSDGDTLVVQYTPSIALPFGPEEYHGLPGLIVHLQKHNSTFQLQEFEFLDEAPVMPLPKVEGKVLTREKLEEIRERKEKAFMNNVSGKNSTIIRN